VVEEEGLVAVSHPLDEVLGVGCEHLVEFSADDVAANQTAAEACLQRAVALARQQDARWWELRATVSLCRLIGETCAPHDPRYIEARQMLAEIYAWFSEGFELLDLHEAREMLEVMGAGEYHNG